METWVPKYLRFAVRSFNSEPHPCPSLLSTILFWKGARFLGRWVKDAFGPSGMPGVLVFWLDPQNGIGVPLGCLVKATQKRAPKTRSTSRPLFKFSKSFVSAGHIFPPRYRGTAVPLAPRALAPRGTRGTKSSACWATAPSAAPGTAAAERALSDRKSVQAPQKNPSFTWRFLSSSFFLFRATARKMVFATAARVVKQQYVLLSPADFKETLSLLVLCVSFPEEYALPYVPLINGFKGESIITTGRAVFANGGHQFQKSLQLSMALVFLVNPTLPLNLDFWDSVLRVVR